MTRINRAFSARMQRIRNGEGEQGFTLIELLVVIIIIGILAAIAIPVFLNQRQSAWKASIETDTHNAVLAVESYGSANGGSLPASVQFTAGSNTFPGSSIKLNVSSGNTVAITNNSNGTYTIVTTNSNMSGTSLTYTSSTGQSVWAGNS